MPSLPRSAQIDVATTPYYHCIARCVRRAFLCGDDPYSGATYDHRRQWFVDRLRAAAEVFAIDVCAYAILSNHFHVVLRIDPERAAALSDNAVLIRTGKFFPHVARAVRELPQPAQAARIARLRDRLTDISWFMRVINEHVARRANKEDECTGHFWEGRFKSQALLDEAALYTCMSYVDLNPVRAGLAKSLEGSDHTSIQSRLRASSKSRGAEIPLVGLRTKARASRGCLNMRLVDYVELLEWSGRAVASKGGRLEGPTPALLAGLGIDGEAWIAAMRGAGLARLTVFGEPTSIANAARRRGQRWLKGKRESVALFRKAT